MQTCISVTSKCPRNMSLLTAQNKWS